MACSRSFIIFAVVSIRKSVLNILYIWFFFSKSFYDTFYLSNTRLRYILTFNFCSSNSSYFCSMGHHYIYPVLDWEKPEAAIITTVGTFALAFIIHFTLFWVSKLRMLVQRRYFLSNVDLQTIASSKCTLDSVAWVSGEVRAWLLKSQRTVASCRFLQHGEQLKYQKTLKVHVE